MNHAEYWIRNLRLVKHPEGGYYRETYRSVEQIVQAGLPARFNGDRTFSTSIYFLLESKDRSLFHRIQSDETWYYHAGSSLTLYVLCEGKLTMYSLGANILNGESLQITIPATSWFGAIVNGEDSFTLSGCNVSPGFEFKDFELGKRSELLLEFPNESDIITRLTKD